MDKEELNKVLKRDLERDIYFALSIIDESYQDTIKSNEYSKIYRFTNEPIHSYAKYLQDRERVLAVTGSGDQILKCIEGGTKEIDTFDISHLPKYFLELKLAAAKNLTRNEFYQMFYSDYFDYNNKSDHYAKFRDDLPLNSKIFWDTLMSYYSWGQIYSSRLFTHRHSLGQKKDLKRVMSDYSFLRPDEYEVLKENAKHVKVNAFTSGIDELHTKTDKSYDLIYLSDIIDYYNVPNFKNSIDNLRVNPNGIILNTFLMASAGNKYSDFDIMRNDGYKEEKTDRMARLLVKRF